MQTARKVIITCAVTGSVHTPTMSPHLPVTPAQIADQSIAAARAGAAILHLHARDPSDGRPSADPALFMEFLPRIKDACDAVLNLTTGGDPGISIDQRLAGPRAGRPELTSLNMGTMNFAVFPVADKYADWVHPWEEPFIRGTKSGVNSNTFQQIEAIAGALRPFGTRFEFECYDVGHLYTLAHFADAGVVEPPFFIQCVLGVMGGIGADPANLTHMRTIADKLFGDDWLLSVLAVGRHQFPLTTTSAAMGGHVRVGMEDNLFIERGRLATGNHEHVAKIREIVEQLGLAVATPAEARAMLRLKGGDQVAF